MLRVLFAQCVCGLWSCTSGLLRFDQQNCFRVKQVYFGHYRPFFPVKTHIYIYIYKDTRKHWPQRSLQVEPPPKRPTGWRPHQPNQLCWGCLLMVSGRCGHLEKGSDLCCETDAPSFLGANGPHVLGEERRRGAFLLFGSLVANGMKWIRTCISTASIKLQRPRILLQSAVLHRRRCLLHFLAGFLESPET